IFFFSSRRRHTRWPRDWSSDVCSSDLFEGEYPSYWNEGSEPAGATLSWATDDARSFGRSLKITKGVTSDSAAWISDNMVDYWSRSEERRVGKECRSWWSPDR